MGVQSPALSSVKPSVAEVIVPISNSAIIWSKSKGPDCFSLIQRKYFIFAPYLSSRLRLYFAIQLLSSFSNPCFICVSSVAKKSPFITRQLPRRQNFLRRFVVGDEV